MTYPEGKRYYKDAHGIRRTQIDDEVTKVIYRLNKFGYKAFLVGGGVRDLLIGKRPKDFDIATSATPNQIKKMFNNCRIIGRRFKIVHILFKGKVIEVSTFRSLPDHRFTKFQKDKNYLITKDNSFGNAKEDAARRDFTVNALYYDIRNESIIDFVGGFEDSKSKVVRVIGDPEISFREDPVRMLRAVKFSTLLGFELEKKTKLAIKKLRGEIEKASKPRMLEEFNKIFRTWRSSHIFKSLAEVSLFDVLLKESANVLSQKEGWQENFLESPMGRRLALADKLLSEREEVTPAVYFAILFSDLVESKLKEGKGHFHNLVKQALDPAFQRMGIPKRDQEKLLKMFSSQNRFMNSDPEKLKESEFFQQKDYFYDSFMLFKILALANKEEDKIQKAMFWEIAAGTARANRKEQMEQKKLERQQSRPHNKPRHDSRESDEEDDDSEEFDSEESVDSESFEKQPKSFESNPGSDQKDQKPKHFKKRRRNFKKRKFNNQNFNKKDSGGESSSNPNPGNE